MDEGLVDLYVTIVGLMYRPMSGVGLGPLRMLPGHRRISPAVMPLGSIPTWAKRKLFLGGICCWNMTFAAPAFTTKNWKEVL